MRQNTARAGLLALSLLATAAAVEGAGPPRPFARPLMDDGVMRTFGALLHADGLSAAQREQMHAIIESDRNSVEPILEQLRAAGDDLVDGLLAADAPTGERVAELSGHVDALRRQLLQQQVATALSLRAVLTADQLEQVGADGAATDEPDVLFFQR